jgi:hypothetical protein
MERPEWGSGRDGNIFESRENDGCHWEVENQDDEDIQEAVNRQSSTLPLNPLKIMHLVHFSINLLPFTCIRTLDFSSGWVSSIWESGSHSWVGHVVSKTVHTCWPAEIQTLWFTKDAKNLLRRH